MSEEQKQAVPHVPLTPNDIQVIDDILKGILGYLRNTSLTPQTIKRIQELEEIRGRLLFLRVGGHAAMVTQDDIQVIRESMISFVKMTRRIVPQSPERDETLRSVDKLRKYLEKHLLS